MAKFTNSVRRSAYFGFDSALLGAAGVLDPTLNVDTALFIDQLLLPGSRHREISIDAQATYEAHFVTVIRLLAASKTVGDVLWRSAMRHLSFPEIKSFLITYEAAEFTQLS